jgi:hypothetical protein
MEKRLKLVENSYCMPIYIQLIVDRWHYNERTKLPVHELVVRPLLEKCIYSYVYGLNNNDELYKNNMDILIKEKGKYKLNLSKECILGHEYLWNITGGKRGSIIIVLENDLNIFNKIFENTFNPSILDNPNTGNTISAIKKCKEEMGKGNIGICFSASNGIENMIIYTKQHNELLKMAENKCRKIDIKEFALKMLKERGI